MGKKTQTIIVAVLSLGLAALLGCASVMDAFTPCYVPKSSLKYADAKPTSFLPFSTLWDAKRVDRKMDFVHLSKQTMDTLNYNFSKGLNTFHMAAAQEFQTAVFSPSGPIGLLFPALAGTGIGALLIKRPGDKSKKEIEIENGKGSK